MFYSKKDRSFFSLGEAGQKRGLMKNCLTVNNCWIVGFSVVSAFVSICLQSAGITVEPMDLKF